MVRYRVVEICAGAGGHAGRHGGYGATGSGGARSLGNVSKYLLSAGPRAPRKSGDRRRTFAIVRAMPTFNVDEAALGDADLKAGLTESVEPAPAVVLCAQIEAEVAGLDAADAAELLRSYGHENR